MNLLHWKLAVLSVTVLFVSDKVTGHPGEVDKAMFRRELSDRQLAANTRHVLARRCASSIASFQASRRMSRRSTVMVKRQASASSAAAPHVTSIQNSTCITAPEVTEGPYYINNEMIRTDLRESQGGVTLILDIGVMDVTTCQPLSNAFVELWNCNATGSYAGYGSAAQSGGGTGGGGGSQSSMSGSSSQPSASAWTGSAIPSGSGSYGGGGSGMMPSATGSMGGAMPSGSGFPGGGGGGGGGSTPLSSNETFLRGGSTTNSNGIIELTTIYPGFYTGRTAHVHTMIHTNWSQSDNGTIISHSGSLVHIGQLFFDESWNYQVFNTSTYLNTSMTRTYNSEDSILDQENADGYNAYVDLELLGSDITDGVLGYITIGVNSSASHSITNTNYYDFTSLTSTTDGSGAASLPALSASDVVSASNTSTGSAALSAASDTGSAPASRSAHLVHTISVLVLISFLI